jgi:mRNA interferase MazF
MRDLEPAAPITGEILTSQVRSIDTQTRPIAFAGSVAPEWVLAEARAKLAVLIGLEG